MNCIGNRVRIPVSPRYRRYFEFLAIRDPECDCPVILRISTRVSPGVARNRVRNMRCGLFYFEPVFELIHRIGATCVIFQRLASKLTENSRENDGSGVCIFYPQAILVRSIASWAAVCIPDARPHLRAWSRVATVETPCEVCTPWGKGGKPTPNQRGANQHAPKKYRFPQVCPGCADHMFTGGWRAKLIRAPGAVQRGHPVPRHRLRLTPGSS